MPESLWWGTCQGLPVGVGYLSAGWRSGQMREVFRATLEGWGHMTCWLGGRLSFSHQVHKSFLALLPRLLPWVSNCTRALGTSSYSLFLFFSSRGWGLCLDDRPSKDVIALPSVLPGVLYDVNHQCRLQYGSHSAYCEDMDVSEGMRGIGGWPSPI